MYQPPIVTISIVYPHILPGTTSNGDVLEPSLFDVTVLSDSILNPAFPASGTVYDSFCLDKFAHINIPGTYSASIYSPYELGILATSGSVIGTNVLNTNLDSINWLLNYYTGANAGISWGEVQGAIWKLLGQDWVSEASYLGQVDQPDIDALAALALTHDGYVPDVNENIGIVLDPVAIGVHQQPIIIETKAAKLGDYVWHDLNGNGLQDTGEPVIAGAIVNLVRDLTGDGDFDDANEVLATTTTDSNGLYSFKGLTPGLTYQVQFQQPVGFDGVSPRQADGNPASGTNSDGAVSSAIVLAPGENNPTLDAGFYKFASLGDRVWYDTNKNGVQDSGEGGVKDVKVTLLDGTGAAVGSPVTTDASGNYLFSGLKPGTYSVQFDKTTLPANYSLTTQDAGGNTAASDLVDSDANPADGKTIPTVLDSGENDLSWDAGIKVNPASLGDFVWEDKNANGVQDEGEAGISGVTVQLKDAGGTVVQTTTTDGNGKYGFTVDPGTYSVAIVPPTGYVLTGKDLGGDDTKDSDIDSTTLTTPSVTLAPGENNPTLDAGFYKFASLGDRVWYDTNKNGVQDSGEGGVKDVKVTLLDGTGAAVGSPVTTDASGNYLFSGLKPGTYSVQFDKTTLPANYSLTTQDAGGNTAASDLVDSDANPADGKTIPTVLDSGENDLSWDAGIKVNPASLGDFVWEDKNANGVQDEGEAGISGVTVQLKDAGGTVVQTTTTDGNGKYGFTVDPGTYSVAIVPPTGYVLTGKDLGGDDTKDSDIDSTTLTTPSVTLAPGENNPTLDAGFYKFASLGDRVWYDTNKNGVQDSGEGGVKDVKVTLLDGTGAAVGSPVTTDASGNYLFSGLKPGTYSVQFDKTTLPANYSLTTQDAGGNTAASDLVDSDANPADGKTIPTVLDSGENDLSWDAGIKVNPASLGDFVWEDKNANGVQDEGEAGISGVTVQLKDAGGTVVQTTTTDGNGKYGFTVDPGTYSVAIVPPTGYVLTGKDLGGDDTKDSDIDSTTLTTPSVTLAPGENNPTLDAGFYKFASLGDRVWYDTNKNGVQDSGEGGVKDVKVTLLDGTGAAVGSPVTTDASGNYLFSGLKPGTYSVQFDKTTLPANYSLTTQDAGGNTAASDLVDSDANPADGKTIPTVLDSGENDLSWDAGIKVNPASLGDFVWEDKNANGVQDEGEAGISGVTVQLKDAGGTVVQTTTTDGNGKYGFTVDPGTYSVAIVPPTGYVLTGKDLGGDDTKDSDIDSTTLTTPSVTLAPGENNPTLDAGFYKFASLGDRVWYDTNKNGVQDSGEGGVKDVKVTLLDGTGAAVGSPVTTDASGNYLFSGLKPGTYSVQFDKTTLPANYSLTTQDAGGNTAASDLVDSDANPADGKTIPTVLDSGENDLSWDAGVVQTATPGIDIEKKTTGSPNANPIAPDYDNEDAANGAGVPILTPGTNVTWTYQVTNTGNTTFAKSDVAIVDDNGTPGNTADDLSVGHGITFVPGFYDSDNFLSPGEVWLYQATGTVQNLTATTFDFSGSSATSGNAGNVRTFTSGALSVNTSAFSREKGTNGAWAPAWLGRYGGGLGVTDSSEGNGSNDTHTVDNIGRDNYVLFEFSLPVVVDSAYLGYVVNDSDATVWIGTVNNAFTSHLTLSDAVLSGLGFTEVNLTDLSAARLADLNAGNVSGNVLVVAAWTADDTPEDRFKIDQVTVTGVYENKATVTAPGAPSDSDLSHYKNPAVVPVAKASIGNLVWEDKNANGVQDTGESGIAGVTVKLLDSTGIVVSTKTTDSYGKYLFSDLNPGDYKVQVVAPTGYFVSPKDKGGNDETDSDIHTTSGQTMLTTLTAGEIDLSWDAGLYRKASVGDKVWDDMNHNNLQDTNEPGIKDITVKLMDATGSTVLATTTTNSSGNYLFSDLTPGTYVLQFDKTNVKHWNYNQWNNMSNWKWAVKDTGSNDAIDSDVAGDANATTNVTKTSAFTLVSNQYDPTRDAGITPIVIDLDGNGIQTVSRAASGGSFDLFGNGSAVASGWISGGDGFLAVDKNGNGKVDSISELFGGTAKGAGFAQLTEYDSNGDGLVNAGDTAFADLRIWRDINGNHQTDDGELMTLAEAGVSQLVTAYTELPFLDRQGNVHLERSSATMSDGQTVDMTDVYFNVSAEDAAAAGVTLTGIAELLNAAGSQTSVDAGWLFA